MQVVCQNMACENMLKPVLHTNTFFLQLRSNLSCWPEGSRYMRLEALNFTRIRLPDHCTAVTDAKTQQPSHNNDNIFEATLTTGGCSRSAHCRRLTAAKTFNPSTSEQVKTATLQDKSVRATRFFFIYRYYFLRVFLQSANIS